MEIEIKYVVYEKISAFGSDSSCIKEVDFGWQTGSKFDSEEDAINALIKHKKTYDDYLILRQIHITPDF